MSNNDIEKSLASALIAEMDNPKVWNGAPEYAGMAMVTFAKSAKESATIWSKLYTRELPKSRAREIAEEYQERWLQSDSLKGVDVIEAAIEKALSEREADKCPR